MAIGSDPEVGKKFTVWGKMSPEDQQAWWDYIREEWDGNIMAGYATVYYPPGKAAPRKEEE